MNVIKIGNGTFKVTLPTKEEVINDGVCCLCGGTLHLMNPRNRIEEGVVDIVAVERGKVCQGCERSINAIVRKNTVDVKALYPVYPELPMLDDYYHYFWGTLIKPEFYEIGMELNDILNSKDYFKLTKEERNEIDKIIEKIEYDSYLYSLIFEPNEDALWDEYIKYKIENDNLIEIVSTEFLVKLIDRTIKKTKVKQ